MDYKFIRIQIAHTEDMNKSLSLALKTLNGPDMTLYKSWVPVSITYLSDGELLILMGLG